MRMKLLVVAMLAMIAGEVGANDIALIFSGGTGAESNYAKFNEVAQRVHDGYTSLGWEVFWADGPGHTNDIVGGSWPEARSNFLREPTQVMPDSWVQQSIYQGGPWLDHEGYFHSNLKGWTERPAGDVDFGATREGVVELLAAAETDNETRLHVWFIDHGGSRSPDEGSYVYGTWSGQWAEYPGYPSYPNWIEGEPLITGAEIQNLLDVPFRERDVFTLTCHAGALAPFLVDGDTGFYGASPYDELAWILNMRQYLPNPFTGEVGPRGTELYPGYYGWGDEMVDLLFSADPPRMLADAHVQADENDWLGTGVYWELDANPVHYGEDHFWSWGENVDGEDLAWLGENWSPETGIDGVLLADLGLKWRPAVGEVPEPTSLAFLLFGVLVKCCQQKKGGFFRFDNSIAE